MKKIIFLISFLFLINASQAMASGIPAIDTGFQKQKAVEELKTLSTQLSASGQITEQEKNILERMNYLTEFLVKLAHQQSTAAE